MNHDEHENAYWILTETMEELFQGSVQQRLVGFGFRLFGL